MSSLVHSGVSLGSNLSNDERQIFVMGDAKILVIYGAGPYSYETSTDGVTWGSSASVPGCTGTLNAVVQNGDTLYALSVSGTTLYATVLTYSAGSLSGTAYAIGTGITGADGAWDSTHDILHVTQVGGGLAASIGAWNPASPAAQPIWTHIATLGPTSVALFGLVCISSGTATLYAVVRSGLSSDSIYVIPATYAGTYSVGSIEFAGGFSGHVTTAACSLNASNQLDVLTAGGGALSAITRVGTNVYSGVISLISSGATGGLSLVTAGNDLVVFFESVINQANGEIYSVWRQSGSWSGGRIIAGGDSAGYTNPKTATGLTGGRYDLVYQKGADVEYGAGSQGAAPDAPTLIAPIGAGTDLTPDLTGGYSNTTAPADSCGGVEYRITRVSDSFVMWRSGQTTDTSISRTYGTGTVSADPNHVDPTALSLGIQYAFDCRAWDSILLPKQPSTWSTALLFTVYAGGTVTITDVTQGGVSDSSSPTTISGTTFDSVSAGWIHPASHAADQARLTILLGGAQVAQQTFSIAGTLASGATFAAGPWTVGGLSNSTSYTLVYSFRDATSGLWSDSADWTILTAWTPPGPPTGLIVTPNRAAGTIDLAWANNGTSSEVVVIRAPSGTGDFVPLYDGPLITTYRDPAPMATPFDYAVYNVDSTGVAGSTDEVDGISLGANGDFGVSIMDLIDNSVIAWLGVVDQWEDATSWEEPEDVTTIRPLGNDFPMETYSLQNYVQWNGRQFLISAIARDIGGSVISQAFTVATLRAIRASHNPCLYRDVSGAYYLVTIKNLTFGIANDKWPLMRVKFDVLQVGPSLPVPFTP